MTDAIEQTLKSAFAVSAVEVIDDSALHAGHREASDGGNSHYRIRIVSPDFTGKTRVQRHRMVYTALQDRLKTHIHALGIQALTPEETA